MPPSHLRPLVFQSCGYGIVHLATREKIPHWVEGSPYTSSHQKSEFTNRKQNGTKFFYLGCFVLFQAPRRRYYASTDGGL